MWTLNAESIVAVEAVARTYARCASVWTAVNPCARSQDSTACARAGLAANSAAYRDGLR